jgi:hypothetical protein
MVDRYISKYAESVKKDKKAILEGSKNRLQAVRLKLKNFKEDEAKELEKVVDEISAVATDIIDNLGIENPAVQTVVNAGQEVAQQANVIEEPVIV